MVSCVSIVYIKSALLSHHSLYCAIVKNKQYLARLETNVPLCLKIKVDSLRFSCCPACALAALLPSRPCCPGGLTAVVALLP